MLDQIATENFFAVIILGDFNAHYNFFDTTTPNSDIGVKLFHFLECNNLSQLIDEPTHITLSGETILDLYHHGFAWILFVVWYIESSR
jgi:hypothetical protein